VATVSELRTGLANRLATISGLRASAQLPEQPTPPQAVVYPQRITYDGAFRRGHDEYTFTILVIVGRAGERTAQTALDAYCNGTGASSIKTAVEADSTLGGKAIDCRVTDMTGQGSLQVGDASYITAEFTVTVLAT
jgi:hypothetical protein